MLIRTFCNQVDQGQCLSWPSFTFLDASIPLGGLEMTMQFLRVLVAAMLLFASVFGLSMALAWRASAAPGSFFVEVPVSINALMVALIDHSAHEIWEAGDAAALKEQEWLNAEQHAIQLAAGGSLISTGGTGTADYGRVMSPAWQEWAQALTDGALAANEAIETRDQQALLAAGREILGTCQGCHQIFKPDAPTEGFSHTPYYEREP